MSIDELKAQNRALSSELERLRNNIEYIDAKLDEELEKSARLEKELTRLRMDVLNALQSK